MLAYQVQNTDGTYKEDPSTWPWPLLGSPKIDGIRAVCDDGRLISRKLKPIPNAAIQRAAEEGFFPNGADGELHIPGRPFHEVESFVMSEHPKLPQPWEFSIFDNVKNYMRFEGVLNRVRALGIIPCYPIRTVAHELLHDVTEFLAYLDRMLAQNWEGVCLRHPDRCYKYGRSTFYEFGLVKVKKWLDAEATIVSIECLMTNTNPAMIDETGHTKRSSHQAGMVPTNKMGAITVVDDQNRRFNIGTGFDDAQRSDIWNNQSVWLGAKICFSYQATGNKTAPRHPVFKGRVRDH